MSSIVRASWYPAAVRLPGGEVWHKVRVILAQAGEHDGLHVFRRPEEAAYRAEIDWVATPPIPRGRQARNGVSVQLMTGEVVVVTPGASCRCGALGRWAGPDWARNVTG